MLQLVWGRLLALTFGGSQFAVAAVLAGFMLGMGVGSVLGGRIADRVQRPLRWLVGCEVALAVAGPLVGVGLVQLPGLAAAVLPPTSDAGSAAFLAPRLGLAVLVLLVPTTLIGATFPLVTRGAAASLGRFHRGLGALYGANTIGACAGAFLAGFGLLPAGGVPLALAVAGGSDLVAALIVLHADRASLEATEAVRSKREQKRRTRQHKATPTTAQLPATRFLVGALATGALVLAMETVWHRAFLVVLANSTASLTALLAVVLAGLGIGGAVTARWRPRQPLAAWSLLQAVAAGVLALQLLLLPLLPTLVRLVRPELGWERVLLPPLTVAGAATLPLALLLGAAWPLLLAAATPRIDDGGRRVGVLGLANSFGAAAGAAGVGFVVLPALGFGRALLLMAAAHLALAAMAADRRSTWRRAAGALAVTAGIFAMLAPPFGRVLVPSLAAGSGQLLEYIESPAGTVAVVERDRGARVAYVDNNAVIGTGYEALKIVRMLGLVPTLVHPEPERVLVIGFGAGVTTAVVTASPQVEHVDVAEIVPAVVDVASHFAPVNHRVDQSPKVHIKPNDGRNHLLITDEPYDVITCDPVHPLLGSAPLYAADFFRLCRRRLAPGGVMCQYLPLHRMPPKAFARAIASFRAAFPECRVLFGLGHAMLLGANGPLELSWPRWQQRLAAHPLRADLADSNLHAAGQIAAVLHLDPAACASIGDLRPSTDLRPDLEFLAPAAYERGLWRANVERLLEHYASPLNDIEGLPPELIPPLKRLVAGKKLLTFALVRREAGDRDGMAMWLRRAQQIAGDDPEVLRARQLLR